MQIRFKKGSPDFLECVREDGSIVAAELSLGSVFHDLAHFVVETRSGNRDGFWGKIEQGFDIKDYDLPNETRPFQISEAGYHAEFLATLLQGAVATGRLDLGYFEMLKSAASTQKLPFPDMPEEKLFEDWIAKCKALSVQWQNLEDGETLVLTF